MPPCEVLRHLNRRCVRLRSSRQQTNTAGLSSQSGGRELTGATYCATVACQPKGTTSLPEAWGHLAPILNRPTRSARAIIEVSSARLERRFEDRIPLLSRRRKDPRVAWAATRSWP